MVENHAGGELGEAWRSPSSLPFALEALRAPAPALGLRAATPKLLLRAEHAIGGAPALGDLKQPGVQVQQGVCEGHGSLR